MTSGRGRRSAARSGYVLYYTMWLLSVRVLLCPTGRRFSTPSFSMRFYGGRDVGNWIIYRGPVCVTYDVVLGCRCAR